MAELLAGETVYRSHFNTTVAPLTSMPYVNDRDHTTVSTIPPGVTVGTAWHAWNVDFGAAVSVSSMRVWDPVGADTWPGSAALVEFSDDGSAWTSAPYTYSTEPSPSGVQSNYALTGAPLTHRWWRVRLVYSGFHQAWGISEWFIDGPEASAVADFFGTPTSGPAQLEVEFADTSTGGPTSWDWDFGDGSTSTDQHPTHIYTTPGTYTVTLSIDGGADELVRTDYITVTAGDGDGGGVPEMGGAILEIYVHDEDASRWGVATWATGAATGTEGIWSAAGWQDVTPQGVTAHVIWGSREPDKGILARQNAASWNVETYDPDRILDPGNADSPFYPQIIAGTPIRISHEQKVIRTGYIDRIGYKYKHPDYRGQLLCTDTISLLNQAMVPEDSVLRDFLWQRLADAVEAAGVAVGGIPVVPPEFIGPAIAALDTDNPRERSVWDHITAACEEVLWIPLVQWNAEIGLRNWAVPLDRGREITATNLEDLEAVSHEDGLYSVVRVQGDDPLVAPIEREAAPLPRYGRRVFERTELTLDPEGFADSVLQDRSWPGVRYSPGTIHCWTNDDVDYFGSLQVGELVTITVPGVVSVQGRILGGEMWVQHYRDNERGPTWQFRYAVATDGSTAIGLTTLVADGTGETLLDDATDTDYLEAD